MANYKKVSTDVIEDANVASSINMVGEVDKVEMVEKSDEEVVEKKTTERKKRKKFEDNDEFECCSVVDNKVYYESPKNSRLNFSQIWDAFEKDVFLTYEQIREIMKSNKTIFTKPWVVINDDEVFEAFPELEKVYENYAKVDKLEKLFKSNDNNQIRKTLKLIPDSMKAVVKNKVRFLVSSKELSNVSLIRLLEKDLECELLNIVPEE